jgi:adenine-specific DNA-methyltransferase
MTRANFVDKFILFESNDINIILNKMLKCNHITFKEKEIAQGIVAPQDFLNKSNSEKLLNKYPVGTGIFVITDYEKENLLLSDFENEIIKPYYTSLELKRFYGSQNNKFWVIYTNSTFRNANIINKYPNIQSHLDKFKNIITSDNKPYGLHRSRDINFFEGEKILSLRKCLQPTFTFTNFPCYVSQSFFIIKTNRIDYKFLLGILNSKLIAFWLKYKGKMQGTNYQIDKEPLLQIPIYDSSDKPKTQLQLIKLVDTMLQLNKDLQAATLPEQKEQLQARIKYTDKKIDRLVYQLYQLTDDEIKIVEGE